MRRLRHALALGMVATLALSLPAIAAAPDGRKANATDSPAARPTVDRSTALVQLKGAPVTTATKTRPAPGKKVDFNNSAVKSYRAELAAERNAFKSWLKANAPKARIAGSWDVSLHAVSVKLNGTSLATLRTAPQVARAEYQGLYYPIAHEDPDLAIIDALDAWNDGGGDATAGEGVKVAIVDTGIDHEHPCFDDAGYPAQARLGDPRFTNNKVIAAKVFYNKADVGGLTAEAIQDHGTHVAGTVACNLHTEAEVDGVDIPYDVSGVAPRALLGNYNVFPGEVASARSEDILNALDAAYADGFDVANMSLGGGANGIQDLLTVAVDNLDAGNMVVAVAAGNSGPGHFTVESPGSAARALTAGASTVPHFVGAPLRVGGTTFGVAAGDFETVDEDLTAPLGVVGGGTAATGGLGTACSALPAGSLSGEIALISRGTCTFSQKILVAQDAGAVAAIVVNNVAGDPTAMGLGGLPTEPTIPAYMAGLGARAALMAADGQSATIDSDKAYFSTTNVDIMAGFSSQGPTDVDFRIKPDAVAPGVNVLSSVTGDCGELGCWAFFQGTSMATPHLAGSAAVVKWAHPTWSAAQIRSAIVNSAERNVVTQFADGTTTATDVQIQGAGRENLHSAVNAEALLDPVSVSFGAIPAGAGQTKTFAATVTNLTASSSLKLSIADVTGSGVSFSVPASVTVGTGASATFTVTMTATKGASRGDHQAWLIVKDAAGRELAHAAVYTFVK